MNWAAIAGKLSGTVDQHLVERNTYLLTENRLLRRRIDRQLHFTDSERIELARAAKPLGRAVLAGIATLVTPDTLLRWHRRLVEKKIPPNESSKIGRPPTELAIVELVLQFARGKTLPGDTIASRAL
jgi:hypothetical protein